MAYLIELTPMVHLKKPFSDNNFQSTPGPAPPLCCISRSTYLPMISVSIFTKSDTLFDPKVVLWAV